MHINKINNKKYIGLSKDPFKRWGKDGSGYKNNKQVLFSRAIKKYGWDNFDHIVLYENLTKEQACDLEIELIKEYNTQNPDYGYNIQPGGQLGNFGVVFSEESRKKMSEARKGRKLSEEQKKLISERLKGHKPAKFSEEFIQKQRERNLGKIMSEETKQKISKTLSGIKKSSETRIKMSENHANCVEVYCPEYDMIFHSITEAENFTGASHQNINKCLKGERKSAGKHKITKEKLHWIKTKNNN